MPSARTIVHIDMDCFYAAIEVREHPHLAGTPVAVGGRSNQRVSSRRRTTRRASSAADPRCPRSKRSGFARTSPFCRRFDLDRAESQRIREIFEAFTGLIEPLSLDEAYLDVTHSRSRGGHVAAEIRARIFEETRLTASAGIAPNKFLAKVASDLNKPNGQYEVVEAEIPAFMENWLPRRSGA